MKKFNYLLLGLAGLTMASCSQDDLLNGGADGNYQVRINLPADMATRASIGDFATAAQKLNYAIFDMEGNYVDQGTANFGGGTSLTLPLYLASGSSFQIAFFAQSPESTNVYSFNASETAHSVTVNYGNMKSDLNNLDDYDCFYNLLETGVIGSNEMKTEVTLNRIVAQINWGTNDFVNATVKNTFGDDLVDLQATLTATAYETFDLLTKEVSDENDKVTIGEFTPDNKGTMSYPVKNYEYVAMQYVLVPAEKTIQTLTLDVTNGAAANTTITVDNAPVQANYRTNIYGNLLTDNIEFKVDLSADWGGADYQVVESSSAFADALKAGGNVILNSDIQLPSVVTISNDAVLDLNGHTIYGPSANNDSADGAITVTKGATLTIKGDGKMETRGTYASILLWALDGSTINIEGGTYQGNAPGEIIYIGGRENSTEGGTVNISGGTFISADDSMLNCKDADYKAGTAKFVVTGGIFYNWNPSQSKSENPVADWVPAGYEVVTTTDGTNTLYVVVPEGTNNKVVSNSSDLATAISANDGATIYLTPGTYTTPNVYNGNVTLKGLDAENTILIATQKYWQANGDISLSDLTVRMFPQVGMSVGFEGATSGTFNNVTFECEFHAMTGNNTFTNCTFSYDPQYYGEKGRYNLWIESRTDGTTTVTDCQFNNQLSKGILVYDNSSSADNLSTMGNISISNCTFTSAVEYNKNAAVEIHSENFKSAGILTLTNCSYSGGYTALWQEKNNGTSEPTHFYTVIVNGVEVQKGGQTAGN